MGGWSSASPPPLMQMSCSLSQVGLHRGTKNSPSQPRRKVPCVTGNKSEAIVVWCHSQERAELIFKSRLNPQLPAQVPLTRTTPHPTLLG